MRKTLIFGCTALAVSLGAASAYALPPNSPYAIWSPQAVDPPAVDYGPGYGAYAPNNYGYVAPAPDAYGAPPMVEGRSAYVEGDRQPYAERPYGMEQTIPTPEDQTYFSRGR